MLVNKVTTKIFNSGMAERIRTVLSDGTVFSTIKHTLPNGDVYSKTKKNGKTVLKMYKSTLPICGKQEQKSGLYTEVKRFLPNGDMSIAERFVNYYKKGVLSFMDRNHPIIPTKKEFPMKEIITTVENYSKIFNDKKRIFTGFYQESPVGSSGTYTFLDKRGVEQELNVYKEKLREVAGELKPSNLFIRYFK